MASRCWYVCVCAWLWVVGDGWGGATKPAKVGNFQMPARSTAFDLGLNGRRLYAPR